MSGPDFYKYIRAFNRLEKAIQRHMDAKGWTDDADDSLHHAWRSVLKDVGPCRCEGECLGHSAIGWSPPDG